MIVFFYFLGGFFAVATVGLFIRVVYQWSITGIIPGINFLTVLFTFMSASLFTLFAMWFDMSYNQDLK